MPTLNDSILIRFCNNSKMMTDLIQTTLSRMGRDPNDYNRYTTYFKTEYLVIKTFITDYLRTFDK